ncbi:MAG TPA: Asp23/Gls24 family envelope stress response protein, partial [Ktedonobacterales bacterium]|nr:Asp23/Gls24 family envelope stress response protein [Ktedonobacterales bacterium]
MNRHPPSAHQPSHAETPTAQPSPDPLGSVRVTRQVLATIIEHAALEIEGVSRLAPMSSPWPRLLFRAQPQHGIALNVHGESVAVDLYLILDTGANMA